MEFAGFSQTFVCRLVFQVRRRLLPWLLGPKLVHCPVVLTGSVSFLHGAVGFVRARWPFDVRLSVSIFLLWMLF